MSQRDVNIVQAFIDAFNRADWDGAVADAAPEFELDLSRAVGPEHGVYGRDDVRRLLREFAATWASVRIEGHEFVRAGDQLVVPMTMYATGRDGIEVPSLVTWTWAIRDGVILRATMYQRREEALEALGPPQ